MTKYLTGLCLFCFFTTALKVGWGGATATHGHYCCLHDSFFPNVSIIGNKCTCSVKYNGLWFSLNTSTKPQATELKATVPGWRVRRTFATASWAALSLRQDCKLCCHAISSCTNWQMEQRWSNHVIKVTRLHDLVLLTLTCQIGWWQCCEFLPCLGRVRFHAPLQRLSGMWNKPFAVKDCGIENVFSLCRHCASASCDAPDGRLPALDYVADLLCVRTLVF